MNMNKQAINTAYEIGKNGLGLGAGIFISATKLPIIHKIGASLAAGLAIATAGHFIEKKINEPLVEQA